MPSSAAEKKERARESRRRWREKNPEKYAAIQRRQYERHAERRRAAARDRYADDPDRALERNRCWREANPEKKNAANSRWRGVPLTPEAKEFIPILAADPCAYCGAPTESIDHIVPVAGGGTGEAMNLIGACSLCNCSKHSTPLLLFMLRRLA